VREHELSNQIADLARRLDALGGELMSPPDETSTLEVSRGTDIAAQALITELTRSMDGLQRLVDQLRRAGRTGSSAPRSADAASEAFDATGLGTSHTPMPLASRCPHGVHFSRSHDHTVAAIIEMFDDARALGRPAVVVATRTHRRWIEADLHQRCIAFEGDVCRFLDAETTLSSLLVGGEPDRDRFRSVVGALLSDVCSRHPGGVSVYGEMVGLLWSEGRVAAAMRLEELWSELQRELHFSLLCGYLIDGSPDSTDLDPIRHVHTYVG
jgi:MEDS: MEthanogen/methylotroph, DcmR Sensory domain